MKKIVKQAVGIDVAQKELVVAFGQMHDDWSTTIIATKTFHNTKKGFELFLKWCKKHVSCDLEVYYAMEATGVYHEAFAYYLDEKKCNVSIVLPNKISSYFRTLDVKTVTDKTASEAIVKFALERKLDRWQKPNPIYKKLKQLTRERDQVLNERTMTKNRLHAELSEAMPNESSIMRIKERIDLSNQQEKEINKEIRDLVKENDNLKKTVSKMVSIPGLGDLTAVTILAETNGFELIKNKRQLVSYAGLDVKEKLSGTSVKGKPKISKRGNRYLRKAMYFPALAAIRVDQKYKNVFTRLVSKHGLKLKAAVAVQRKILELSFIIFKNQSNYIANFEIQGIETTEK
jgi:transposase